MAISTATPLLPTALYLTHLHQNDDSEYPVRRSTERPKSMSYGARLFCCDSKNRMVSDASCRMVSHMSRSYLSIGDMIRTRGFQQNSGATLRSRVIAISDFGQEDLFLAISSIKLTVVSYNVSSYHSNTSGAALRLRSRGSEFNPRSRQVSDGLKNTRASETRSIQRRGRAYCPRQQAHLFYCLRQ